MNFAFGCATYTYNNNNKFYIFAAVVVFVADAESLDPLFFFAIFSL